MKMTHGFCPCDVCGIGLGEFMFHEVRAAEADGRKAIDRWVKVHGEKKVMWDRGEITLRWLEFNGDDLEWVEENLTPKKVCEKCEKKYKE